MKKNTLCCESCGSKGYLCRVGPKGPSATILCSDCVSDYVERGDIDLDDVVDIDHEDND